MPTALAKLEQHAAPLSAAAAKRAQHLLIVLPKTAKPDPQAPHAKLLDAVLARRQKKFADLAKSPLSADAGNGALVAWVMIDDAQSPFEKHTAIRKAVALLLA